jgi:hypothetical protein
VDSFRRGGTRISSTLHIIILTADSRSDHSSKRCKLSHFRGLLCCFDCHRSLHEEWCSIADQLMRGVRRRASEIMRVTPGAAKRKRFQHWLFQETWSPRFIDSCDENRLKRLYRSARLIAGIAHVVHGSVSSNPLPICVPRSSQTLAFHERQPHESLSEMSVQSDSRRTRIEWDAFVSWSLESIVIASNVEILYSSSLSYRRLLSAITTESDSSLTETESTAISFWLGSFESIVIPRNVQTLCSFQIVLLIILQLIKDSILRKAWHIFNS